MRDIEKAVKSKQDGAFLNLFVIPNSSSNFFPQRVIMNGEKLWK